jgi:hypothetical protein
MNTAKSKISLILGLVIVAAVAVFVIVLFNSIKKETEVSITETQIEIIGHYGTTYQIQDVDEVSLEDAIPKINRKVNGSELGDIKKGNFEVEGLGNCKLFIHSKSGPYVYILMDNGYTFINFEDSNKTQNLYELLLKTVD